MSAHLRSGAGTVGLAVLLLSSCSTPDRVAEDALRDAVSPSADEKACDEAGDVTRAMSAKVREAGLEDPEGMTAAAREAADEMAALAPGTGDELESLLLEAAAAFGGLASAKDAADVEEVVRANQQVASSVRALADYCGGVAREE